MVGTLSSAPRSWKKAAELRFRGQWLRQAGFHPGMTVVCRCISPGVIELRVSGPAQLNADDFQAVLAPFNRLGI